MGSILFLGSNFIVASLIYLISVKLAINGEYIIPWIQFIVHYRYVVSLCFIREVIQYTENNFTDETVWIMDNEIGSKE